VSRINSPFGCKSPNRTLNKAGCVDGGLTGCATNGSFPGVAISVKNVDRSADVDEVPK